MHARISLLIGVWVGWFGWVGLGAADATEALEAGVYRHEPMDGLRGSVVREFTVVVGEPESTSAGEARWWALHATKADGQRYRIWLRNAGEVPSEAALARDSIGRYIVQEGDAEPVEYVDRHTRHPVLPGLVDWKDLWPRVDGAGGCVYLGHRYRRFGSVAEDAGPPRPPAVRVVALLPDVLMGLPSNTRQKDERRRFDGSDYELIRLTRADYQEMVEAGLNCLRVDQEQLAWVESLDAFYWGVSAHELPFPECLYRSRYLGPALFLDEPAVGTRDHVLRPRFAREPSYRRAITAELAFEEFRKHYDDVLRDGPAAVLRKGLAGRADVDSGTMSLRQRNLYSWETMIATAAWQLSRDPEVPDAMVFEPPGRLGTLRTLPEMNMAYGCQIPADNPANFTAILYGFLRGAARLTGKAWGTSIYGAVERQDAFWFMTRAYDLGATRFFFWDNAALACVPYGECLALARNLRNHAASHPDRNLARLRAAAETAIVLPAGYDLGHVMMGKGNLWGLPELNLERTNSAGVTYRHVMGAVFTEIERCLRLGVAFDLLWDLPGHAPSGYRETVRVRPTGEVDVEADGRRVVLPGPRSPARPEGAAPRLDLDVSASEGPAPLAVKAAAVVTETAAPVWYSFGADTNGVYRNAVVAWEIYGPNPEDQRILAPPGLVPRSRHDGARHQVDVDFTLSRPGSYRLRVTTTDLAGRSSVVWKALNVSE